MWEITGEPPAEQQHTILTHLSENNVLELVGTSIGNYRLTADPISFFPDTLLCCLVIEPPARIIVGGRKTEQLNQRTAFYFLFRTVSGNQQLIPIADGAGNLILANRHLGLQLTDDQQRLDYARFYFAFARTGRPPAFRHLPSTSSTLRFQAHATDERVLLAQGALWRFMDQASRSRIVVTFQRRGVFPRRSRHHAHVPVQYGKEIYDVDINIWQSDGHISDTKFELIYADEALAEEPKTQVGHLTLPGYVRRRERWWLRYQNLRSALIQLFYITFTIVFGLASALALLFVLEGVGISIVRRALESVAGDNWRLLLCLACAYCITHFALTTFLVLDIEMIRSSVLTLRPSWSGGRLDEWLYEKMRQQQVRGRSGRLSLLKRVGLAVTFLLTWLTYLVLVFTSLQLALRPHLLTEPGAIVEVMTIFGQQALQYVPVVFYYVGRTSMDPSKRHFVILGIMLLFQLSVGLLVIRRIHRFWSSTSRARRLHR